MRIVLATYDFLPSIGGVATTESVLARAFVDQGHEVTVVTLGEGPVEGYPHAVVRRPGPATLFRLYRDAEVLILSNLAIRLIWPLLILRRPFALRHHSESAFRLSRSPVSADLLRRVVLPRARHFMTSDFIGQRSGFEGYAVTPPFANPHLTPDRVRPPGERSGLLFVGRMEPEKGLLWLLERWAAVREGLGVERLTLVGNGSLRAAVERRIAGGALPDVVSLGPLSFEATAVEMGKAAYLVVPSLWGEPFGAVALEGVAAGAIVLRTDRGGLPEATDDLGVTFDPDDEASVGRALVQARDMFESHRAAPEVRSAYERRVADHVARFRPERVVETILKGMAT
ncbi:glycosyltransferase family 4 protein [Brevundimonas staleyi]|uniref:Glycosyltransferase family 4 protein n=1 Tax=Brevundimonas staleyi TaxID=74326 RepID=A0ABW0FMI7_9CAUL